MSHFTCDAWLENSPLPTLLTALNPFITKTYVKFAEEVAFGKVGGSY
jgi:hypothetical protein